MKHINLLILILILITCVIISCNKESTEPVQAGTLPAGNFSGNYLLYDSVSIGNSPLTQYRDTIVRYPISRTVSVYLNAAAGYAVSGTDTFWYNDKYIMYEGYYSYILNPTNNDQIIVTQDSVKYITKRSGNAYMNTMKLVGYRIP
ncbi:MAG: hypothetical protein JST82_09080 [Bacteroidetes bacterium]|nr:hypothetical protein [Bacteroidota bacterium]